MVTRIHQQTFLEGLVHARHEWCQGRQGWGQAVRSKEQENESGCHEHQHLEGLVSEEKYHGMEAVCEEKVLKCLEDKEVHDKYQWSIMNLLVSNLRKRFYF